MGTTSKFSLRYPASTDVPNGPQLAQFLAEDVDGLLVYHGINADNESHSLPETQLSNFIQFRLASDRLFAGQIDPLP